MLVLLPKMYHAAFTAVMRGIFVKLLVESSVARIGGLKATGKLAEAKPEV